MLVAQASGMLPWEGRCVGRGIGVSRLKIRNFFTIFFGQSAEVTRPSGDR